MARDLIQISRGLKAQIPTLAQGEMGLALDTHEVFIGGLNSIEKVNMYANVKNFGAKGDGVADDTYAVQQAFNSGMTVYFPEGSYNLNSLVSYDAHNVSIVGDGVGKSTIVLNGTTSGLSFTLNTQALNVPPQQALIKDIKIKVKGSLSGSALKIGYNTYQPNAQGNVWLHNVSVTRNYDGTGSFVNGIELVNVINLYGSNVHVMGDDLRVSQVGIKMTDVVGVRFSKVDINRVKTGVKAGVVSAVQNEGIQFNQSAIYDIDLGLDINKAINVSYLDSHININGAYADKSIKFQSVSQSVVTNCLLYFGGNSGDPLNQECIRLVGSNGNFIQGNTINGLVKTNTSYAIVFDGGSGFNIAKNNIIANATTGFNFIGVADNFNDCSGNIVSNVTTEAINNALRNILLSNSNGLNDGGLMWQNNLGTFKSGQISADSNWGGFIKGYEADLADLALADKDGNVACAVKSGSLGLAPYSKSALPSPRGGGIIYVHDATGGAVIAFSNGTNWLRCTDASIIN